VAAGNTQRTPEAWSLLATTVATLAVVVGVGAIATADYPAGAASAGVNGKIAFRSDRDGNAEIYADDSGVSFAGSSSDLSCLWFKGKRKWCLAPWKDGFCEVETYFGEDERNRLTVYNQKEEILGYLRPNGPSTWRAMVLTWKGWSRSGRVVRASRRVLHLLAKQAPRHRPRLSCARGRRVLACLRRLHRLDLPGRLARTSLGLAEARRSSTPRSSELGARRSQAAVAVSPQKASPTTQTRSWASSEGTTGRLPAADGRANQFVHVHGRYPGQLPLTEIAQSELSEEFAFEQRVRGVRDKYLPRLGRVA
jgi:hypothetical protein